MNKNTDLALLIIRLSVGILMIMHGISKLFNGLSGIEGMLAQSGLPSFIAYGALVGEVLAPIMIIIGFRTRLGALILAINCIFAVALVHSGDIFTIQKTGAWALELLGLYFFGSIALVFSGAGKYAVSTKNILD